MAVLPMMVVAQTGGAEMSSFNGSAPVKPQMRLAVLGDSDSHAFHDAISLKFGTAEARGGQQQASTWQWTEMLAQLRPQDIDQGPFGEVGSGGMVAWARRNLMGTVLRHRKEDFRYNFAVSGAGCSALGDENSGQVAAMLQELNQYPDAWKKLPAVVVIRIGINDLGTRERLQAFSTPAGAQDGTARAAACADAVGVAVKALKARYPNLHIILVGVLNNVDWPPIHQNYQDPQSLGHIAAVLDVYDRRLRELANKTEGVEFFDDRAFFRHYFGARDAAGKPAYKGVSLGGKREVKVTQGDEPFNAVIGDGHAGTVWNGLWAAALVERLNRIPGVNIRPIEHREIARLADPQGQFGLGPELPAAPARPAPAGEQKADAGKTTATPEGGDTGAGAAGAGAEGRPARH